MRRWHDADPCIPAAQRIAGEKFRAWRAAVSRDERKANPLL
jgi:hypothetical protein